MDNKKFVLTSSENEKNKLMKIGYSIIKKIGMVYIFENMKLPKEELLKNDIDIKKLLFTDSFFI